MEFEDIQAALAKKPTNSTTEMQRRTFLKLLAAGVGTAMMPAWVADVAAAAPALGANDGVLVVIQMGGGNDGLNTVVPISDSTYYARRGSLAIAQSAALPLDANTGLHPSLVRLKARYDSGKVAVVQGVGHPANDLSHFECMANWMSGWAPTPNRATTTGWLGRYLDGLGTDPLFGVSVGGSSVPLHLVGARNSAAGLATSKGNLFLHGGNRNEVDNRFADAMRGFGTHATGWGAVADTIASTQAKSIETSGQVQSCYSPDLPAGALNGQMSLIARLINANLGTRVYGATFGSFDHHENAGWQHEDRMEELDQALETFFTTLDNSYAGRVTVMTFSEFGRRVQVNGSGGTDHGTAGPMFVIGDNVRGGLYGALPSLTGLNRDGNMNVNVEFHQVYGTLLGTWLSADENELLGKGFSGLDLFRAGPTGTSNPAPPAPPIVLAPAPQLPPIASSRPISFPRAYRIVTANGRVHSYGGAESYGNPPTNERIGALAVTPDQRGYWLIAENGGVFTYGNAPFHGSAAGLRLNAPVVGAASTASGDGYWLLGRDGGIFSYGDAAFFGSTGAMKLNQPVVGMATTPQGKGYWLVASDGGMFAFGDAGFHGSMGGHRLNEPVVGMAPTPDGGGYWLVARDGGIFAFGNAQFYGSMGGKPLNKPIASMAATPSGRGYRMVASDGGVFCFGDSTFEGSLGKSGSGSPAIGILI